MSLFSASTTAEEVIGTLGVSLRGKNILVTGASSGIGVECCRVFALAGGNVWLAGRDVAKTVAVADRIISECGDSSRVHVIACDLSNLTSVRKCVDEFIALDIPLHILLNNAGCMAVQERTETVDGFEMQLGTNHLGHFVLTNGLLAALTRGAPSRVVNVSSMAHHRQGMNFKDPMSQLAYTPVRWTYILN
jgi:NAD(P)-dependent dehydrogenase (short-subunit alcohol dehydrogenase family)